jgi:YHS domain-containing protein
MSYEEGTMFRKTAAAIALLSLCIVGSRAASAFAISGNLMTAHEHHKEKAVFPTTDVCPVSGEEIDKDTNITYEYKGKTYRFCCPDCAAEFKKDPQ